MLDQIRGEANGHITGIHNALREQNERLGEQCHYLARLVENTYQEVAVHTWVDRAQSQTLTAAAGTIPLPPVPAGALWVVELISVKSDQAATHPVDIGIDDVTGPNFIGRLLTANAGDHISGAKVYVPERRAIVAAYSGFTVGDTVTIHVQARQYMEYSRERARDAGD